MTAALRLFFLSPPSRDDPGFLGRRHDRATARPANAADERSDAKLLDELCGENEAVARTAFETLFRRHTPVIFAATFHRGGHDDGARTEDAVQAVMMRLWERRRELPHIDDLSAYLVRAAARQCVDTHRATTRATTRDAHAMETLTPDAQGADEHLIETERSTAIHIAVLALPGRMGELFRAWWLSDATYDDVAAQFGVSTKAVYQARLRAIAHLRNDPALAPFLGLDEE